MLHTARRFTAAVVAATVLLGGAASAAPAAAVSASLVALNSGAAATADATVTVAIPAPVDATSTLRISNDGGTSWVEQSYAASFPWSLVDPAAGGTDGDGAKTVAIEAGDGVGPWTSLGSAGILLDRTGPVISGLGGDGYAPGGWGGSIVPIVTDAGVGVAFTEISLDGTHWISLNPAPDTEIGANFVDLRDGTIGGSWVPGLRHVYVRATDLLGNVGVPLVSDTIAGDPHDRGLYELPATFELPLSAVAGEPFTIKPVMDPGFTIPAGYYCFWELIAGDRAARIEGAYNPTLIRTTFSVAAEGGACSPWTFTLPFTPPLEYSWRLAVSNPHAPGPQWWTYPFGTSFRAEPGGTTSRAIPTSSLPLYYVVPDRDLVDADGTVTYHLYRAGGAPVRNGTWSCRPAVIPAGINVWKTHTQEGGTVFRCPVTVPGAWQVEWSVNAGGRQWLVQYDPVGDRRAPVVTAPVVRVSSTATPSAVNPPVVVVWSGRDVGTGLARYQLQRSVNGRAWTAVTLAGLKATSAELRLHAGSAYRFRVRAKDRAGNWSAWVYGATVRAGLSEETSRSFTWSAGWTRQAASGASRGAVRAASAPGQRATFRFTGNAVGWFARKGPGQGFAQVRVDGVLVATVNLEAATLQPSSAVWRKAWARGDTHTVQVRLLGTSGRPRVEIDAFEVVR